MNKEFAKRIKSYLDSECDDYGLSYKWEWNEDMSCIEVEIKIDYDPNRSKYLLFKYNEKDDDLLIELSENCFYVTREFDETAKYFWMLVAPALFFE